LCRHMTASRWLTWWHTTTSTTTQTGRTTSELLRFL
jgi:hypothetical protein